MSALMLQMGLNIAKKLYHMQKKSSILEPPIFCTSELFFKLKNFQMINVLNFSAVAHLESDEDKKSFHRRRCRESEKSMKGEKRTPATIKAAVLMQRHENSH